MKRLIVRADGGPGIGMGHVVRCLSVARCAERLRLAGADLAPAVFVSADGACAATVENAGIAYFCLGTDPACMEAELPALERILSGLSGDPVFLVDSYRMTSDYLRALGERGEVAVFDDLGEEAFPVGRLVNYNIYGEEMGEGEAYRRIASAGGALLLGPRYMPLRREYEGFRPGPRDGTRVLILTGATDPFGFLEGVIEEILRRGLEKRLSFTGIAGLFSGGGKELAGRFGEGNIPGIRVLESQESLVPLMRESDFCITAGGSTVYELIYAGVIPLLYSFADNQLPAARTFDRRGLIPWMGDLREDGPGVIRRSLDALEALSGSPEKTRAAAGRLSGLVDGGGAERIARTLLGLPEQKE